MIFDFDNYVRIQIPEGMVKKITDGAGNVIWKAGYVNMVPISTTNDGVTIYNGTGYKNRYRIRSGGAEGAQDDAACTGFIPVNGGDIIRISGCDFAHNTTSNAINVADASFSNIGQITPSYANAGYGIFAPSAAYQSYCYQKAVTQEKTGVWKWTVPPAASGVAYIRVSGYGWDHGANMIVTANEEIESSDSGDSGDSGDTGVVDFTWPSVAASIKRGTYATDYKIGDTVPLDLGTEGVVNMEIVAFDADELADGSGKAAISWVAQEFLATKHRMNPAYVQNDDGTYQEGTGGIGGWETCEMRTYLNDTILPMIPNDVQGMLKAVVKYSTIVNTSGSTVKDLATDDVIWIPSHKEIITDSVVETLPPRYSISSKEKGSTWWTRTSAAFLSFRSITASGKGATSIANLDYGVVLGFCT